MTHHPIRVEPDGTRVYANYHRYRPLAQQARKYRVHKPADPRAVRFGHDWYLPLTDRLLPDQDRSMPVTKMPKSECTCRACSR